MRLAKVSDLIIADLDPAAMYHDTDALNSKHASILAEGLMRDHDDVPLWRPIWQWDWNDWAAGQARDLDHRCHPRRPAQRMGHANPSVGL
jgi:hypothetical protein